MSRALYPEIARFKYKNKWVKVDIPIRIKLIKMIYYVCPECKEEGKLNQIINWAESYNSTYGKEKKDVEWDWEYDKEKRKPVPKAIMENGKISYCVLCFAEKDKKVKVSNRTHQMYKVYAQTNPENILLDEILWKILYLNYQLRYGRDKQQRQYESFHDKEGGLKEIYEKLRDSKKRINMNTKSTEKCSIIIKKGITDEVLENANYLSSQNKFVKQL